MRGSYGGGGAASNKLPRAIFNQGMIHKIATLGGIRARFVFISCFMVISTICNSRKNHPPPPSPSPPQRRVVFEVGSLGASIIAKLSLTIIVIMAADGWIGCDVTSYVQGRPGDTSEGAAEEAPA